MGMRTMNVTAMMLALSGCYASHGTTSARVDGLSVEDGWMEGDFGAIRGVSASAYQIDLVDRRPDGQAWMSLHVHSGARGGDEHPWAMFGFGLREMSLDESSLPVGARLRFAGLEPGEPGVELWACSGAAHDLQEFEASATIVEVQVLAGATAERREVVFDAQLDGAQRVRGGFTLRREL